MRYYSLVNYLKPKSVALTHAIRWRMMSPFTTNHEPSSELSQTEFYPVHRREYLKYLGAVGGTTASGITIGTAVAEGDSADDNENEATPDPLPAPTGLNADFERNPTNLRPETTPRLSWRVEGDDRDRNQSAYRVRVASVADAVNSGGIWDSGRVESSASTTVRYGGPALDPDETYHWMVRV